MADMSEVEKVLFQTWEQLTVINEETNSEEDAFQILKERCYENEKDVLRCLADPEFTKDGEFSNVQEKGGPFGIWNVAVKQLKTRNLDEKHVTVIMYMLTDALITVMQSRIGTKILMESVFRTINPDDLIRDMLGE